MDAAKQYLKDNNIVPKISFKDKQAHTVELVKDKMETITDRDGKEIEGVSFLVTEDGEPKKIFTTSISLIQKLSECKKGDVVTIQMKSRKDDSGGYKSYYEVTGGDQSVDETWEDIPDEFIE